MFKFRFVVCFMLVFLLLSVVFTPNVIVSAVPMNYSTGFEDGVLGSTYNNSWLDMNSTTVPMQPQVSNTYAYDGSYSIRFVTCDMQTYNFSSGLNITTVSFAFYAPSGNPGTGPFGYDFFSFENDTGVFASRLQLEITTSMYTVNYLNSAGGYTALTPAGGYPCGQWIRWTVTMIDNDTMHITNSYDPSTSFYGASSNPFPNFGGIRRINWTYSCMNNFYIYMDALDIYTNGTYSDYSYYGCDVDDTTFVTLASHDWAVDGTSRYIEVKSDYRFTGTLKQVSLIVNLDQYNYIGANTTDYYLYLNGYDMGYASYFDVNSYRCYIVWCVDLNITNDYLVFELASLSANTYDGLYWSAVYCGVGSGLRTYLSSDSYSFGDGISYGDEVLSDYGDSLGLALSIYYIPGVYDDTTESLNQSELDDYKELYGKTSLNDSFIVFYTGGFSDCYYGIGSYPKIVYYLDSICVEASSDVFMFNITDSSGHIWYTRSINLNGANNVSGVLTLNDFTFPAVSTYYIWLYNTTAGGTVQGSFLYKSFGVFVCDAGYGGYGDGDYSYEEPFFIDSTYGLTIAFLFCLSVSFHTDHVPPLYE